MGRAERRKEAKNIPRCRRNLTDNELLSKIVRNGITVDDVKREVAKARKTAYQEGLDYATQHYPMCLMKVMIATFDIVLHDECYFGNTQIKEVNDALLRKLAENKDYGLDEVLDELHEKANLKLEFKDMTDDLTDIAVMGDAPDIPDIPEV